MSVVVREKSIGMWTNEELIEYLDLPVCTQGTDESTVVIAECLSRALYGVSELARLKEVPNA